VVFSGGSRGGTGGPGTSPLLLFWVKEEEMTEGRKGQVKQNRAPLLAQGLDPPLVF